MSRSRQIQVSSQTQRTHASEWQCGEVGTLGANFAGALDGRTIASVAWTSYGPVSLSSPSNTTTTLQTRLTATGEGIATVTATVTLDNGEKRVQRFLVAIR